MDNQFKWFFLIGLSIVICAVAVAVATHFLDHPALEQTAIKVGLVAGIVTGVWTTWQKIGKPLVAGTMRSAKFMADMEEIVTELRPNKGSSLRDAVNRIEARLINMEGVQSALRQDGPIGIIYASPEGYNSDVNRTMCRWLKCGKLDMMGRGWRNFVCLKTHTMEDFDDLWKLAFGEGREVEFDMNWKPHGVEGCSKECFHTAVHCYPIFNLEGEVQQYLIIVVRDRDDVRADVPQVVA